MSDPSVKDLEPCPLCEDRTSLSLTVSYLGDLIRFEADASCLCGLGFTSPACRTSKYAMRLAVQAWNGLPR